MNVLTIRFFFTAALVLMQASLLGAAQRTFVSAAAGSDVSPCTRALPCRSFGVALAVTDPGGEVVALDSGGYGPFTVNQTVRIEAPAGIAASLSVFSGTGVTFSGGSADRLVIRGLQMTGLGGESGFIFHTGASAHLERVRFTGFSGTAVAATDGGFLAMHDGTLIGNTNGLQVGNGMVKTRGVVTGSRFHGHASIAVASYQNGELAVVDSVVSGNANGLYALAEPLFTNALMAVESTVVSHNGAGITAGAGMGGVFIWVSGSTITQNAQGLVGSSIQSRSNNTVQGNDAGENFTGPFSAD